MQAKNKTLFLLIIGFVFLFLASVSHLELAPKITAEKNIDAESARTELRSAATSSREVIKKEKPETAKLSVENISEIYYRVVKVVDGDTIDVMINGKTERLRLIGINTPEIVDPRKPVECFGREASDNAKKLLDGAEVKIAADSTQDDKDIYGRLLRYVWRADGLFYNSEAIKDGFAYEYTYRLPYIYQKDFKAAQKYAQDNQLGLWADGACNKKNIVPALKNNSTAASAPTDKNCVIKGNISSESVKIYHLPNCPYYKQTIINESQGEKWFCTEAEAVAAGWRKAGNCP